jgi:hypothetical protein
MDNRVINHCKGGENLTSETLMRFSKLIQPGNVLNIYGLNDKIKLLVPLVLHSNNLS